MFRAVASSLEYLDVVEEKRESQEENKVRGEIILKSQTEIEWNIPNFFLLPEEESYYVESPQFPYLDGTWSFRCFPNGELLNNILLSLKREHCTSEHSIICKLGMKREDGLEYVSRTRKSDYKRDGDSWGLYLFVDRNYLFKHKKLLTSQDTITFFCSFPSGSNISTDPQTLCKGKDVATETTEKDFRYPKNKSIEGERTPRKIVGKDVGTKTTEIEIISDYFRYPKYDGKKTSGKDVATKTTEKDLRYTKYDGKGTSGKIKGKDVATQTIEKVFRYPEHESVKSEGTSDKIEGSWQTRISQLYDTKESVDIHFVVNRQLFEAHRFVLVTRSQEFNRLLTGSNATCDTHIVEAENITVAGFDILLRFLYKDILDTTDRKSIVEAYQCAIHYRVQELADKCMKEMNTWNVLAKEVCTLLDCGLDLSILRNKCIDVLRREAIDVLLSPTFMEISSRTLHFILESDALKNVPTLERINRILKWCVHPNTEEDDYSSVRIKLLDDGTNPLLGRLQLETLDLKDLSHVVQRYRGLITPEELVSFLKYQHTGDASVLPDWCIPESSK